MLRIGTEVETEQCARLAQRRAGRDRAGVDAALAALRSAVRDGSQLVEPMLAAARLEATLGELCGVLRQEWGGYVETARF